MNIQQQRLVESVQGQFYRCSQNNSLAQAIQQDAYDFMEWSDGYVTALDVLISMAKVANRLSHKSEEEDIRIQLTINQKHILPECFLSEAPAAIDAWILANQ